MLFAGNSHRCSQGRYQIDLLTRRTINVPICQDLYYKDGERPVSYGLESSVPPRRKSSECREDGSGLEVCHSDIRTSTGKKRLCFGLVFNFRFFFKFASLFLEHVSLPSNPFVFYLEKLAA